MRGAAKGFRGPRRSPSPVGFGGEREEGMQRVEFSPRRAETELSGISSDEDPRGLLKKAGENFTVFPR